MAMTLPDTRPAGLRTSKVLMWLAVLAICAAAPFLISGFQTFQLANIVIYAIAILGLNLLLGYSGQISIGHSAFFAIGGYTAAILLAHTAAPAVLVVIAAGAVCFAVGFLFGFPALRLGGIYLALATFALAIQVPQLLKYSKLEFLTGGVQGLHVDRQQPVFGLTADQSIYFLVLGFAAVLFLFAWGLINSRTGHALIAIRDQPVAAESMGIDIAYYKTMVFGMSAMYTGIAGALSTVATGFVSPDSFPFFLSLNLLIGSVVGGTTSIVGAIFGAAFIHFVPTYTGAISQSAPWLVYGVILLALMYVLPSGIGGGLALLVKRLGRWRRP